MDYRGFKDVPKARTLCANISIYKYLVLVCFFFSPKVSNVNSHVREGSGKRHQTGTPGWVQLLALPQLVSAGNSYRYSISLPRQAAIN